MGVKKDGEVKEVCIESDEQRCVTLVVDMHPRRVEPLCANKPLRNVHTTEQTGTHEYRHISARQAIDGIAVVDDPFQYAHLTAGGREIEREREREREIYR
jgi:hypothetical protein